ncbi:Uncharacterised protein [Halioglobus japonicus]|nr:Uncharacterised protein [Halioglobus japonicus]
MAHQRDQKEKDQLIFSQLDQRQGLENRLDRLNTFSEIQTQHLTHDFQQYQTIKDGEKTVFEHKHSRDIGKGPTLDQ